MNRTLKQGILGLVVVFLVLAQGCTKSEPQQTLTTEESFIECVRLEDDITQKAKGDRDIREIEKKVCGILDGIMANPGSKVEFEEAAWLKYEYLIQINESYKHERNVLPKLRKFVNGIDKTKYPEIARYLWLQFLDFQCSFYSLKENIKGVKKSLKEIEKEVARYGSDIPPEVAELATRLLAFDDQGIVEYEKYRKLLAEAPDVGTREALHDFDASMKVARYMKQYLVEYSKGNRKPPQMGGTLASKCGELEEAMKTEIETMTEEEKHGKDVMDLDDAYYDRIWQKEKEIRKKYLDRILPLLDGSLDNIEDEDEFNEIALLNYRYVRMSDEETFPKLRKFVLGIDKDKHPRLAITLWLEFLSDRFEVAKRSRNTEFYNECANEIEQEFLTQDYGMRIFGELALDVLESKSSRKDASYDECYQKYRDLFLNSEWIEDKVKFWEFEKSRRYVIILKRDLEKDGFL